MKYIIYVGLLLIVSFFSLTTYSIELNTNDLRQSGNEFLSQELLRMSKDPSENPISLWKEVGMNIWQSECKNCHQSPSTVREAIVSFPKWRNHHLINLEDQLIQCFERSRKTKLSLEDSDVLSMSAFLSSEAKGLVIQVNPPSTAKDAKDWQRAMDEGARLYVERQGRLNLSCTNCHDQNIGKNLRSDVISPAYPTGFPIYRLSWQTMGSIDRRLRACYSGVQAMAPNTGSQTLRSLELFLKFRARGMVWDGPSIRR